MTTHPERDLLSAYVDDELEPAERAQLDAHLPTCASCRETLAALRTTIVEMRAAEPPMPAEVSRDLRATIARQRARGKRRWQLAAGTAAAAASVVAIVVFATRGGAPISGSGANALEAGPQAATGVIVSDQTFDAASARTFLASDVGAGTAGRGAAAPNGTSADAEVKAGGTPRSFSATVSNVSAEDVAACERALFEGDKSSRSAVLYEAAIWSAADGRKTAAFFLVYDVHSAKNAHRELWVVARDGCDLLYFAQGS